MYTYRRNEKLATLFASFYEAKKPSAAVCHSTTLLLEATDSKGDLIVKGKTWTGFANSEEDYADDDAGKGAKQLMDAGVLVSIGGHGQREGLASHWEMWSFARGGMSPLQALSTATVLPAQHLGFFDDIGSLEKGKLADLVILDNNPLENIRHTDGVDHVMLGGRLYEADTMNEVVTGDKKRLPYWWED